MSKKILMIITSNARMGDSGKVTGFWAEELATPYYHFIDAEVHVDLASTLGGAVPVDPSSVKPQDSNAPIVERFLADSSLQQALAQTKPVSQIDATAYDAIFFPGGHGTMWDLPVDAGVRKAVETAYANQKVIGAVCHGVAGLVTAQRADGLPVVHGVRINAFTNAEEDAVGLTNIVPFALETRLRELGAKFESAPLWHAFAIHDGQFITGQNPQSSELVAHHVLQALGLK